MERAAAAVTFHRGWTSRDRRSYLAVGNSVANQLEAFRANSLGRDSDGCISSLLLEISSGLGMAAVSGDATSDWSACSGTRSRCLGMVPPGRRFGIGSIDCVVHGGAPPTPLAGRGSSGFQQVPLDHHRRYAGDERNRRRFSEEAGFRGYMQGPLEHRYGPASAILTTSVIFGLLHLSHGAFIPAILFDMGWGALYGLLAWRSGSIVPAFVLHAAADFLEFVLVWKLPHHAPAPLVWQAGPDALFGAECSLVVVMSAASVWAFRRLGRLHDDSSRESLAPGVNVHT